MTKKYYSKFIAYIQSTEKYKFPILTVYPSNTLSLPIGFYPEIDDNVQKNILDLDEQRASAFFSKNLDKKSMYNPLILSDSIFQEIKKKSLSNMELFKIGDYYMTINIHLDDNIDTSTIQKKYTFKIQEYSLKELQNNINKYKQFDDLMSVKYSSSLSFEIKSDIELTQLSN